MKRQVFAGFALAAAALAAPAYAADVMVMKPWARATAPGAKVGAGYMVLHNGSASADRLVAATAEAADRVEIHEMSIDNGVMKMRELAKGLDVPAGKDVELKPGSYHLMLMGLKQPLKAGETIKGTVTFEKAGQTPVEFKVESMGAQSGDTGHKH